MHLKINARTLHSIREVLRAATELGADELFGIDANPDEVADWENDLDAASWFLSVPIPHGPVTWHLVDQATANVLEPTIQAGPNALGQIVPDEHV